MAKQIGELIVSTPHFEPCFYSDEPQEVTDITVNITSTGWFTIQRMAELHWLLAGVKDVTHVAWRNLTRYPCNIGKESKGLPGKYILWVWSNPGAIVHEAVVEALANYFHVEVEHISEEAAEAVPVH